MYKQLILKKIYLSAFYFILSVGFGVIASIPFVSFNFMPNDDAIILAV